MFKLKNKKKKISKRFQKICAVLFFFIFLSFMIGNVSADNQEPTDIVMERIVIENDRGSEIITWNLLGYVYNPSHALFNEPHWVTLRYFYGFDDYTTPNPDAYYIYNAITGLDDTGIVGGEMDYIDPHEEGMPVSRFIDPFDSVFYFSFLISKNLIPIDPSYYENYDYVNIRIHSYSASHFNPSVYGLNFQVKNIELVYNLRPVISLDSEYYNYQNTRLEFTTDGSTWYESNYETIVLNHHDYKLRIYDLESNQLLHEDTEYVRFTVNREITIDYTLHPKIVLDSEFYSLDNIRIETYDDVGGTWINQNPYEIDLESDTYKLRIYDLGSNGLLFEDTSYQQTINTRTITIDYTLHPKIILDSEFYSLDNVRFETYDDIGVTWINQNPYEIDLESDTYKLRIYDFESGELIFEDTEYQQTENTRTITIESLKITNNANEPVNVSLIETDSYTYDYKSGIEGIIDWGEAPQGDYKVRDDVWIEGVNDWGTGSDPTGWTEFGNPDTAELVNNFAGHSNVVKIGHDGGGGGFYKDYSGDSGIIDFWLYRVEWSEWIIFKIYDTGNGKDCAGIYIGANSIYTISSNGVDWVDTGVDINYGAWNHFSIEYIKGSTLNIYMDSVLIYSGTAPNYSPDRIEMTLSDYTEGYFDSIGLSVDGYTQFDNLFRPKGWVVTEVDDVSVRVVDEFEGHLNPIHIIDEDNIGYVVISKTFAENPEYVNLWINTRQRSTGNSVVQLKLKQAGGGIGPRLYIPYSPQDEITWRTVSGYNDGNIYVPFQQWFHLSIRNIDYVATPHTFDVWINGIEKATGCEFYADVNINEIEIFTHTEDTETEAYIDAIGIESEGYKQFDNNPLLSGSWIADSLSDFTIVSSVQVSPYSNKLTTIDYANNYFVLFADLYDNRLNLQLIDIGENEVTYTPPNVQINLISIADQRNNYLNFLNYKVRLDGDLIYEQYFHREIGETVNISIYDRFDIYLTSYSHTVSRDDNFIPIQLTLHSLKIFNQQGMFNWVNLTRDPNHYESDQYWSEFIAPGEMVHYRLPTGYWKLNVTSAEYATSNVFSYTLNGDDVLLISSYNTLTNTIINLANVNTTIGNQITNVEINITNQNSQINNSIVNVQINLGNINSSLGDLLISQGIDIENVANNITNLFSFTENNFINLNTTIANQTSFIETNILSINNTISNLVVGVDNSIYLINGTISTMLYGIDNDLLILNTSIHTAVFSIDTTINEIGNNITANYILLNNSFQVTGNNIDDSRIAILNNLVFINNTIMSMVNDIYTSVYLINNSIYSAVVDLGTSLTLINNTISGNLSIVLEQNDFLTEIYQYTMFSDLLNWTGVGYNFSLLESQIDTIDFTNMYRDEALILKLRFDDRIEEMMMAAQETLSLILPNRTIDPVEFRIWSVEDEEYLSEWEDLSNTTVDFGYFKETIPIDPNPIISNFMTIFWFLIIIFVAFVNLVVLYVRFTRKTNKKRPNKTRKPGSYDNRVMKE